MDREYRPIIWLALIAVAGYIAERYQSLSQEAEASDETLTPAESFIKKLLPIAQQVQTETGISARLGVIQASLESTNGTSGLTSSPNLTILPGGTKGSANNLFGFKTGGAWVTAGKPYVNIKTKDYYKAGERMPDGNIAEHDNQSLVWPAPFRAYPDWESSYRDWARLMQIKMYVDDGALEALRNDDLTSLGKALSIHYAPNQNYDVRLSDRADALGSFA